jgi:hypothetical protein
VVTPDAQAGEACAHLSLPGVPDAVCSQALDGFERVASSRDLVCN